VLESGAGMRISVQQRQDLCAELRRRFGEQCRIWLFGSRADDEKRGGDVDLYVEAAVDPGGGRAMTRIRANVALKKFSMAHPSIYWFDSPANRSNPCTGLPNGRAHCSNEAGCG